MLIGDGLPRTAIDADGDLLDFDAEEVRVSQAIIASARQTMVVADKAKFARKAPVKIGSLAEVDHFITDGLPSERLAHACADALLGSLGLGDIGSHFPDTDPQWEGADSIELLRAVAEEVREAGWDPANIDCTVVTEAPKIAPRRDEMQRTLTEAVGAPVTVKGKRAEQLGALGRGEGLACYAVALVTQAAP